MRSGVHLCRTRNRGACAMFTSSLNLSNLRAVALAGIRSCSGLGNCCDALSSVGRGFTFMAANRCTGRRTNSSLCLGTNMRKSIMAIIPRTNSR